MASVIQQLYDLQVQDLEIIRLREALEGIPAKRKQIEARLDVQSASVKAAEEAAAAAARRVKQLEGEAAELREKVVKLRGQQMQIKSNAEYKALEKEIATAQEGILHKEDAQLEAMEEAEEGKRAVDLRKADYAKEKERVDSEIAAFEETVRGLPEELAAAEAERKVAASAVDPSWLARYERLLKQKKDVVIATVTHGTCGGCHMKLSPAQLVGARRQDAVTACDFCGRMLYSPQ